MHPAKSVILFTLSSGAGYGLVVIAALADWLGLMADTPVATGVTLGLALALIGLGLASSTFHLGHPERAWRALTQWRSSWLSREGVAALWSFLPILAWGAVRILMPEAPPGVERALAALAAASALVTLYCTGMIYASLDAVPMWATRWTPAAYLLLGPAAGAVLLNAISHALGFHADRIGSIASVALLLALAVKLGYWKRAERMKPVATAESATGLTHTPTGEPARVSLLESPHSEPNYLMREMGFQIARKHAGRLRRIAVVWSFIFPMLAIWLGAYATGFPLIALLAVSIVTAAVGLTAERYLFFAEARHVQSLYYGQKSA